MSTDGILLEKLHKYFGHSSFRTFQRNAIHEIMKGNDVLLTIPTGGGKSLCFQLPAMMASGLTIIVSPLLSLIDNQASFLTSRGIGVVMFNSTSKRMDDLNVLRSWLEPGSPNKKIHILYTTPETLASNKDIQTVLDSLYKAGFLKYLVIDEVHCMSEWGHDFRPSYLYLKEFRRRYAIPCMACTATATLKVEYDIKTLLGLENARVFRDSFYRSNLTISIIQCKYDKISHIGKLIRSKYRLKTGIIYHTTRKSTEVTSIYLKNVCKLRVESYHAGMAAEKRHAVQRSWEKGEIDIIVATLAFGMGIDKSNVRFVIHADLPKSISDYYQGIGRAGRDGKASEVYMLYNDSDHSLLRRMLKHSSYNDRNYLHGKLADLNHMLWFAQNQILCRHQLLCSQFGERLPKKCGTRCDNCLRLTATSKQAAKAETFDATWMCVCIFKTIICLEKSANCINDRDVVQQWLCTSSGTIPRVTIPKGGISTELQILRGGLCHLKEYQFHHLIAYLILHKYMFEEMNTSSNDGSAMHSQLRLYKKCKKILSGKKGIQILLYRPEKWSRCNTDLPPAIIEKTTIYKSRSITNEPLYKKLHELRKILATENGIFEVYRVASNKSIEDMVKKRPTNERDLRKCRGMGKIRVEKYGERFITCIKEYDITYPASD